MIIERRSIAADGPQGDEDEFGPAAGLEPEGPVADAGGDDEIRALPPLMAVAQGVLADPLSHMMDGDELAAVGVAAQHQVRPRRRFGVEVVGLMVEEHDIAAPVRVRQ